MALAYKGVCYSDLDTALAAFRSDYPQQQADVVYWLSASAKTGTDQITFSTKTHANVASITDGVITLPACDFSTSGFSAIPLQLILFVVALFFAAFLGFRTAYK